MTRMRARDRLRRQFDVMERRFPALRGFMTWLRADRARLVRIPVALLMIFGGLLAFLPFLGLWMIPFGLMLLALDIPFLQGPVSAAMIRLRRRLGGWVRPRRG